MLWIRLGNTSNENLQSVLGATIAAAMDLFARGEVLVEVVRAGNG